MPAGFDLGGGLVDPSMGKDYVEESFKADGSHVRKEVHEENGITTVHVTQEGAPFGGMMGMPGMPLAAPQPPAGLMEALMDNVMKDQMEARNNPNAPQSGMIEIDLTPQPMGGMIM